MTMRLAGVALAAVMACASTTQTSAATLDFFGSVQTADVQDFFQASVVGSKATVSFEDIRSFENCATATGFCLNEKGFSGSTNDFLLGPTKIDGAIYTRTIFLNDVTGNASYFSTDNPNEFNPTYTPSIMDITITGTRFFDTYQNAFVTSFTAAGFSNYENDPPFSTATISASFFDSPVTTVPLPSTATMFGISLLLTAAAGAIAQRRKAMPLV